MAAKTKPRGRPKSPAAARAAKVRQLKTHIRRARIDLDQSLNYVDRYDLPRATDNVATAVESLIKGVKVLNALGRGK